MKTPDWTKEPPCDQLCSSGTRLFLLPKGTDLACLRAEASITIIYLIPQTVALVPQAFHRGSLLGLLSTSDTADELQC